MTAQVVQIKHIGIRAFCMTYSLQGMLNSKTAIQSLFAEYNQQDAPFHNLFISLRLSACFRRVFRPSSGAQNCTYSIRYWSDKYLTLYVQF